MAAEIATSIATTVFDHSLGAIVRQFGYLWNHKKNMADLKAQVKKFDDIREDNNHSVLVANRNADRIKSRVESWRNNAEEISAEARKVMEEYEENAKVKCLIGLCPNVVSRYQLSRKACKKQIEIVEALREVEQFRGVSERDVRRAISIPSTVGYFPFDSRMSTLEKIVNTLQDVTKNSVGVYGFGGMGKTTLVKLVASRVAEKGIFDEIVMALVTQTPDFKEIQGQIAKKLDLKLEESSVAERAGRIYGRLKEKKVLVILDDLWEVLDLEKVGVPFGAEHMGCKILLTSRYQEILSTMGVKSIFQLGALEEKEAWSLFEEKTGDVIKDLAFLNIGKEVAKRCAGLPVLIVTIGASLSNQPNLHAWKEALNQLKKMKNKEMHEFVNSAMEFISYKHLEEPHKRLFLLCGLLGSGASTANLLKYSLGWGLFDEAARVEDARSKLHVLIFDLKASCLLLDGDEEDIIKIHDVVRGVAISIARKDLNMFLVDTELNRWPQDNVFERCTALVFHASGSLTYLGERLACPLLEFLRISSNFSLIVPDPFFECTRILKVLDMSGMSFQTLPPSISFLGNLQTLRLDHCYRLKDISIVGELKKLQVLSLVGSYNIEELSWEIGQLFELRLLDLSGCSALKVIPAGLLKGLSQLEELYMSGSFNRWEAKSYLRRRVTSNVSLAELKHLSNLCSVEIEVPNTQLLPKDLDFENWERFTIIVGDMPVWKIKKEYNKKGISRKISLQVDTTSINHLQHNVKRLLKRAESLCLQELKGIKSVVHELDWDGFPELKHLIIQTDYETKCIVNVETEQHRAFPALESLHLHNLLKLEKICNGRLMKDSFCKLTTVKVLSCNSLESLFSFSMAICLPCLQEIKISSCNILKGIVANKCEGDDNVHANDAVGEKLEFVALRKVSLKCLPQLINFYSGVKRQKLLKTDVQCEEIFPEKGEPNSFMPFFKEVSFPKMEELTFSKISNLKCIWSQYHPEILSLKNLQKLSVEKCGNLKYLFTPAVITCLVGLQELSIRSCTMMKEIVVKEEGESTTNILFPQLSKLCLQDLPNLTTFYSGVEQIGSYEGIGTVVQPLFNEKANFPSLKSLEIKNLDNIKNIWHHQLSKEDPFCKLEDVDVRNCAKLLKIFPFTMLNKIHSVKKVWILDCEALEEVFEEQKGLNLKGITYDVITTVSQLRDLYLDGLPKLRFVWKKDFYKILSFENLCEVDIRECESLKCVFPAYVAQCLHQLEELHIEDCKGLETIVEVDDDDDYENKEAVEVSLTFTFPKLTELYLEKLPKAECFYPKKHASEWPLMKVLVVNDCNKIYVVDLLNLSRQDGQNQFEKVSFPRLEELTLSEIPNLICIWSKYLPSILSFKNLQNLSVRKCDSLEYLFNPSIIVSFGRLQELRIQSCVMMREIVAKGEGDTTMDAITFPQLSSLYLEDLPNLTTFYYGVEEMYLHENTTIQPLFSGKANFPNLKKLKINNLDKIKSMWHNQPSEEDSFCKLEAVEVTKCAALLKIFPSSMMSKIQSVKKVHILDCDALKEVYEVKKGPSLKEIADVATPVLQLRDFHKNLSFENLCNVNVRNCESLKHVFPAFVARSLHQLENLCIEDCKEVDSIFDVDDEYEVGNKEVVEEEVSTITFPKLTQLLLKKLPKVDCFYPKKHTLECPALLELDVDDCDKISILDLLINVPENREQNQFEKLLSRLESLTIRSKDMKMMMRQYGHFPSELFLNLRKLKIIKFHDDESANFSSKFLHGLHRPETLEVKDCSFQEIFPYDGEGAPILLPHLTTLRLYKLPELKYICKEDSPLVPILEKLIYLTVLECPRLTNLVPASASFKFLIGLVVRDCGGLINLMSSSTTAGLERLQWLEITGCQMIEEIVAADGDRDSKEDEIIIFSKLRSMKLEELPRLTNFCAANYSFKFPLLSTVIVRQCPNMGTFSPGITITPQLEAVSLGDAKLWQGDLNKTIQHFSDMETQRLATTNPGTSLNNHFESEAMQSDVAGKEVEEISEELTKPGGEEGQTSENSVDDQLAKNENTIEPREQIGVFEQCNDPIIGEKVDIWGDATKPGKGKEKIEIFEEVVDSVGNEADIRSHPYSQTHASSSFGSSIPLYQLGESSVPAKISEETIPLHSDTSVLSPANEPVEQTNAQLLAPRDVVASSSPLSPTSNCPETSPSLVAEEASTSRAASNSQQNDFQTLCVRNGFITLLSGFLQIYQTQPLNSMSTEQGQLMVDAFRNLSNMNFTIEWFSPYVEKVKERLERKKEISELELKIVETEAQLQALKEKKKALEKIIN